MYKIQLTCFDPPYDKESVYHDWVNKVFERKCEAYPVLLECVIDEADSLNEPDAHFTATTKIFRVVRNYKHEGKEYPAAVEMWDGAAGIKEQPITLYDIVWVNETALDPWNQKLREAFGEDITFGLYSEVVEDEDAEQEDGEEVPMVEKFYYQGLVTGKSELYDTIEEAYEEAYDFMDNIELYVD